ncbi:unnamed protein product [Phytophthora fragariaefolia]|uniref:Unnamed protein product n=1 Tax=Phytophthora fragariaefolia TaxID=1490495 RepID=A0A9W6Y030_9STRA|nr:unnamed protein product [Phytophthora fragariaefolia]
MLFSEAELLDVLTGIDAGSARGDAPGPSVNVVLSEDVLSSEKAFEEFMESLASDDDGFAPTASATSDGSQSEAASSSSPPSACSKRKSVAAAAAGSAAPTKPKRKRRKHELDHLRAVATELEKKLKDLSRCSREEQPGSTHFWKSISNRMMTQRQKSVGENARLRQLVREQVKSVKAMQRALEKTPDLCVSREDDVLAVCILTVAWFVSFLEYGDWAGGRWSTSQPIAHITGGLQGSVPENIVIV